MDRLLLDYLPPMMQRLEEMSAVMASEQQEISILWDNLQAALNDQFVSDSGEYGIGRWETILSINPKDTDSLDDRRFRVLSRINEQLPFTFRTLGNQLETICGESGYVLSLNNESYTLVVRVALTSKSNYNDVENLLKRVVPANMLIDLSLKYNSHGLLSTMTHQQLSAYTHYDVRNEVMP